MNFEAMNDLPETLFANPAWHALQSQHRHFAQSAGDACRYPADVAPFAAVAQPTAAAGLRQLHSLLAPGEFVWLVGDTYPRIPELSSHEILECLQMVWPAEVPVPDATAVSEKIVPLSNANASEMVALTDIAFPGFFRPRTCAMGTYFGVRAAGELIAMSGERLKLDGYSEISGVCTHPAHRGQGLAAALIWQVVRHQRKEGVVSFLHVSASNRRAIDLYHHMGFQTARTVQLHRISRSS
jgi:ribosomal protein S18 acetylase RimI-like enzyme